MPGIGPHGSYGGFLTSASAPVAQAAPSEPELAHRWHNAIDGCFSVQRTKPDTVDGAGLCRGTPAWIRTMDLRIKNPLLYQLSYEGVCGAY